MSIGEKNGRQVTRSAVLSLSEDQGSTLTLETLSLRGWKSDLIAELNRSARTVHATLLRYGG